MFTGRSVATAAQGSSESYGVDLALGFYSTLNIDAYLARTSTPGVRGDDTSSRLNLNYNGERYGLQLEHLRIGDNFNPDVGFVRRDDIQRSFASGRFSPRIRSVRRLRRLNVDVSVDYLADGIGRPETREVGGAFGLELENNDTVTVNYTRYYEFLEAPFAVITSRTLASRTRCRTPTRCPGPSR
jgi:hypothetical protein